MADPGFPVGGRGPRRGGRGLPRRLRFENFVCQYERIWRAVGRLMSCFHMKSAGFHEIRRISCEIRRISKNQLPGMVRPMF